MRYDSPVPNAPPPMPNVLLVAPWFSDVQKHCVQCFLDLPGARVGILTQEPPDRVPPAIAARLAACERVEDAGQSAQLVAAAEKVRAQWGRIDRFEGYLEMLQVPIAEARDALGVDGMGAEVARNFRDKNRMKDVLRQAGVPVARQALVRGEADARAFVATVGYPIVLKPLAGFGARNTQRVTDEASLQQALAALQPTAEQPAQAEEFVQGEEHTFESVVIDGQVVWSSTTAYVPRPLQVLENPWMQYALILPREQQPPHAQAFAATNEKALAALGVRHGLTHMEWFLRDDGSFVVSEVGARPPGANIMPLLRAAHGADPWAAWAKLMVERRWEFPERRFAAGTVFLRAKDGGPTVRSVEGVAAMQQALGPAFVEMKMPQPGQQRSTHYEGDGYVLAHHPRTDGVVKALRAVLDTVTIR